MNELIALALRRAGVNTLAEFQALRGCPKPVKPIRKPSWLWNPICWDTAQSASNLEIPTGAGCPLWHHPPGHCHRLIPSLDPERLPVGAPMRVPMNFPVVPTDVPMTSGLCSLCIRGLVGRYPSLFRMEALTTTAFGRPVEALSIGVGPRDVLYTAAHHANEWITATLLLAFAEDLAKAAVVGAVIGGYPARGTLQTTTIHMVPMVDPDGVDLVTGALPRIAATTPLPGVWPLTIPISPSPTGGKPTCWGLI